MAHAVEASIAVLLFVALTYFGEPPSFRTPRARHISSWLNFIYEYTYTIYHIVRRLYRRNDDDPSGSIRISATTPISIRNGQSRYNAIPMEEPSYSGTRSVSSSVSTFNNTRPAAYSSYNSYTSTSNSNNSYLSTSSGSSEPSVGAGRNVTFEVDQFPVTVNPLAVQKSNTPAKAQSTAQSTTEPTAVSTAQSSAVSAMESAVTSTVESIVNPIDIKTNTIAPATLRTGSRDHILTSPRGHGFIKLIDRDSADDLIIRQVEAI